MKTCMALQFRLRFSRVVSVKIGFLCKERLKLLSEFALQDGFSELRALETVALLRFARRLTTKRVFAARGLNQRRWRHSIATQNE